jgi:hypothetical protein
MRLTLGGLGPVGASSVGFGLGDLSMFSAPANNWVYKIIHFLVPRWSRKQSNTSAYPSSDPSLEGNSPMSSRMVLMKTSVTRGEQGARLVRVLKGVWNSSPMPKG